MKRSLFFPLLLLLFLPSLAFPASRFSIVTFRPSVGDFISVDDSKIHSFSFGTMLDFGYRPLDLTNNGTREREVVNNLFVQHIYGAAPVFSWLSLGADMPITWTYSFADPDPATANSVWRTGIGDLSASAKAAVLNNKAIGLAIVPFVTMPTGDDDHFMGNRGFTGGGKIALSSNELFDRLMLGLNVGGTFRKHVQFSNIDFGHQLTVAAAAKVKIAGNTSFIAEIDTSTPAANAFQDRNTTPTSARGSFEVKKGSFRFAIGAGGGIVHGGGAPLFNAFTMLEMTPSMRNNRRAHERDQPLGKVEDNEAILKFAFGSSKISDEAAIAAGKVAEAVFYKLPLSKLSVTGYADKIGDAQYNVRLSEARAKRVCRYLELHGVPRDRIAVKWKGGIGGRENRKAVISIE